MQAPDQPTAGRTVPTQAPRAAADTGETIIDRGLRALAAFDQWLFCLPFPRFCALIAAVALIQNGLWTSPIGKYLCRLSSDVSRQMTWDIPQSDYLYHSFFGLWLGHWTGAWKSPAAFAGLHLVVLCVGLVVLVWVTYRRFGDQTARLFLLAFATVPFVTVLMTWLGMSDVYMFLFATGLVLAENAAVLAVLALLLGVSHVEQGAIIALGLSVCRVYQTRAAGRSWRAAALPVAALLGGVTVAPLCLAWYFYRHDFHLRVTRLSFLLENDWRRFVAMDARHLGTLIFSLHGCYWLVVIALVGSLWKTRRGLALGIIAFHAVCVGLTLISLDETRIFSILIWPFVFFLLRPDIIPTGQIRRGVVVAFACGLVVPKLVVWEGIVSSSALYDDFALVASVASGHNPMNEKNWVLRPFRGEQSTGEH